MKKETKEKIKKALKYTGIGLGIGAFAFLGYKYIKNDDGPSEETLKLADEYIKQMEKEKEDEYSKGYSVGYDDSILDMVNWCKEHGKSIVATTSSKGYGEANAENWLIAEVVTEKPDLDDVLVDYPYCIKTPKDR